MAIGLTRLRNVNAFWKASEDGFIEFYIVSGVTLILVRLLHTVRQVCGANNRHFFVGGCGGTVELDEELGLKST